MSAFQYVLSLILWQSGLKKRSFVRLNRLGVCVSPDSLRRKISEITANFDKPLLLSKSAKEGVALSLDNEAFAIPHGGDACDVLFNDVEVEPDAPTAPDEFDRLLQCDSDDDDSIIFDVQERDVDDRESGSKTTYQITGDNLDLSIRTKFMTSNRRDRSLHWFNMVATEERFIVPSHLSKTGPRCSIMDIDDAKFVPTLDDVAVLKETMQIHVARAVTKFIPHLKVFAEFVPKHIHHINSEAAAKKSTQVPLGLLDLNEQKNKDMIEICKFIAKRYVPYVDGNPCCRMQFGGDQLTAERARGSILAVSDDDTEEQRMAGLLVHSEDFHCHMNYVNLILTRFFLEESTSESGTLKQLKSLVDRRNISRKNTDVRAGNAFVNDVLDGYLVACAVTHLGMTTVDDEAVPPGLPKALREKWFWNEMKGIVEKYVLAGAKQALVLLQPTACTDRQSVQAHSDHPYAASAVTDGDASGYPCRWYGCAATLPSREVRSKHEKIGHGMVLPEKETSQDRASNDELGVDRVFNYTTNFMEMAMLNREFTDAWSELDGERLFRCWRMFTLYFPEHQGARGRSPRAPWWEGLSNVIGQNLKVCVCR